MIDWTQLLADAGIPDSPGYQETLADCRAHPYVKAKKKPRAKAKGSKKKYPSLKHGAS